MQVSHSTTWNKANRDKINAYKRAYRRRKLLQKLQDKHCLNCEVLLNQRLDWSKGRTYLYCRKCITEYPKEVNRHKCRRSYHKKKGKTYKTTTTYSPECIVSWRTLKQA